MLIDIDTMEVRVNSETSIPLPDLVADSLKWNMIRVARHVVVSHCKRLELTRIGATQYSFMWSCNCGNTFDGYGERYVHWVPRASVPPTDEAVDMIRSVPGFVLSDFILAMADSDSVITSNEKLFKLDHERFGFLEIG